MSLPDTNTITLHQSKNGKGKLRFYFTRHGELLATIVSGLLIVLGYLLPNYSVALFITAFIIGGFAKGKEGIEDLFINKKLNVEILMIIAAIGSAIIGYWAEGAILIFIFALSGTLESYTLSKSESELTALLNLQPDEATLLTDLGEKVVPVAQLTINDVITVKPGERIPVDGVVTKGRAAVDESAITGEAIPVTKQRSDEVYAGTMNINGALTISVTKEQQDTLFQRIINLVQTAKENKSPAQQFIDRFEGTYVKIVLIVVFIMLFLPHYLFGWSWQETWYRAMVLLVVASPCALVASIMPATLATIARSAKQGILFKGGDLLETLASIKAIAFDKTGTITKGKHEVAEFFVTNSNDAQKFLQAVASVENHSTHPLAKAIVDFMERSNLTLRQAEQIIEVSGQGISGVVDGKIWKIGKKQFVAETKMLPSELKEKVERNIEGKSVVFVGDGKQMLGAITLKDAIRKEAIEAIKQLQANGIYTMMLTGDGREAAASVAREANIDHYLANQLPDEKLVEIEKLKEKYGTVAMIGDGINDSPALATANIGIAMGEGTHIALDTADVVLMKNNLLKVPEAIKRTKKMTRIVKQNIFFSIAIILLLVISNFLQMVDLPLGVIGHEGSTLLVILNGLRMLKS